MIDLYKKMNGRRAIGDRFFISKLLPFVNFEPAGRVEEQ